jgi:hypothetical protein
MIWAKFSKNIAQNLTKYAVDLGYFMSQNYPISTRNFFGKMFLFTKAPFWALFFTKRLVTLMQSCIFRAHARLYGIMNLRKFGLWPNLFFCQNWRITITIDSHYGGKKEPKMSATYGIFLTNYPVKQSPDVRKFTPSGHPESVCISMMFQCMYLPWGICGIC